MKWSPLELYQVDETPHGLFIHLAQDTLKNPGTEPLIRSDFVTILEYLIRYQEQRMAGKGVKDARTAALAGAQVVNGSMN